MLFFDGDLCCFCLAELMERYPEEDKYLEALVTAKTPPELIVSIMKSRLVREPCRASA